MTTIAANRWMMSGDTKVTDGSVVYHSAKVFVIGDSIVGVAGTASATTRFLEWFRGGCKPDGPTFTDDDSFGAIVLSRKGLFYYSECCEPDEILDKCYAIGTGAQAALTAMRVFEKDPETAVSAACAIDTSTGGKITTKFVSDLPRPRRRG